MSFVTEWFGWYPEISVYLIVANLFLWLLLGIYLHYFRHPRFPSLRSVRVLFHEGSASGNSTRNLWTLLAGASRCLRVTVTESEVWTRPWFPFNVWPTFSNVTHRIPRDAIISAKIGNHGLRRGLMLFSFHDRKGRATLLLLRLRRPEAFLEALRLPVSGEA